jgi:hypothetical protein
VEDAVVVDVLLLLGLLLPQPASTASPAVVAASAIQFLT